MPLRRIYKIIFLELEGTSKEVIYKWLLRLLIIPLV